MELVQIARPAQWDTEIEQFSTKTVFHESAWLDFVTSVRPGLSVEYFQIKDKTGTAGYFCTFHMRKSLLSMYGSPFPGTGAFLGPLIRPEVDQRQLMESVIRHCRERRIALLELRSDGLDPQVMDDLGFETTRGATLVCPLPENPQAAWEAMASNCRQRIRRAEKSGLVGEATQDPQVAEYFYRFYAKVLKEKGLTPPYDQRTPTELVRHLLAADRLFAVWVKYRGEVIAAAFYPHDARAMYYWDGSYNADYLDLSPNELLHWTAMQLAIKQGISRFNIGGEPLPSRFSRKFGGGLIPHYSYSKHFVPLLRESRRAYHVLCTEKDRAAALLRRVFGRPAKGEFGIVPKQGNADIAKQGFDLDPLGSSSAAPPRAS